LNESSIGTIAYRDELPAAVDCGTAGAPVVSISAEELQQWLRGLLTLPRGSWDIVTMRLQGREWPDIVRRLGVKERTARQRLCRVLRSVPALAVMYRAEVIKRSRRHDNRSKKGR
jgi:hypothetical protein